MSEPRWYHSLYWRIALGLFAFLALMLAAQGALFLWMTDRIAGSMPARDPRRLAVLVASDVGAALSSDPTLDLKQYVRDQYGNVFQSFVVIMQDGRVASNDDDVPDEFVKAVIAESGRRAFPPRGRRFEGGAPPAARRRIRADHRERCAGRPRGRGAGRSAVFQSRPRARPDHGPRRRRCTRRRHGADCVRHLRTGP